MFVKARRRLSTEDGGVLVAGAILMVVLIFLGAVVIEVGAWFQDRRHLQVRADAGALAGAQLFNQCFNTDAFTPAQAGTNMEMTASQYAGFSDYNGTALAGAFTPAHNTSFGTGSNSIAFQSQTYPGGGGSAPDDTKAGTLNECNSDNLALDVKLTRDVGGIFSISPLAHIHAHARVELKEVQSVVPTFPLAVPELVPDAVGVTFINEDNNTELTGCTGAVVTGTTCTYALTNTNTTPGSDPYNLGPWQITNAGVNLPTFSGATPLVTHIGMRVGVGDAVRSCANSGGNGSTWQCFNNTNLAHGVIMISDINPSGAIAAPKLQGIFPATCTGSPFDGDEIAFPNPCWATFGAKIDATGVNNFRLRGTITQDGGTAQAVPNDMNPDGTLAPMDWATVNINPPTGGSEYTVQPCWRTGGSGGGGFNTCPAAWAQRVVGATDNDDGPLGSVSIVDQASPSTSPYSYNSGGIKTFTINVKLKAPFNKITILRQSHDGSATAFILCRWKDPNNPAAGYDGGLPGITGALETGCQVPYQVNTATPPTCSPDPLPSPTNVVNPDCTQNKPSTSMGNQITKSLDTRFGCAKGQPAEHPNNWPNYSEPGDPRAVTLVTTTYDAFAKNGNNQYPVTGFGAFYIAGVIGNSCENSDPADPAKDHWPTELGPEPNKNSGTIWGYFIKYTNLDGTPSGRACKVNSLNNCVAVLTR
jgi:Flp pilus assembly protein TadG